VSYQYATDYYYSQDSTDLISCYCLQTYLAEGSASLDQIDFPSADYSCGEWYHDYQKSKYLIIFISAAIGTTNGILSFFLIYITGYEQRKDFNDQTNSTMVKLFAAEVFNTIVVLFLVNINIGKDLPYSPIFEGSYYQATVQWYHAIGGQLCITMIINMFMPHLARVIAALLWYLRLLIDRGCTRDPRITNKFLQTEYENINSAP